MDKLSHIIEMIIRIKLLFLYEVCDERDEFRRPLCMHPMPGIKGLQPHVRKVLFCYGYTAAIQVFALGSLHQERLAIKSSLSGPIREVTNPFDPLLQVVERNAELQRLHHVKICEQELPYVRILG